MQTLFSHRKAIKIMATLLSLAGVIGALWWALFALKPYEITLEQLSARYAHAAPTSKEGVMQLGAAEAITVGSTQAWAVDLRFASFDGAQAIGRVVYPTDPRQRNATAPRWPVLLALHAMGRTHWRWWQAEFKGRATVESTHLLAERALQSGYAILALDARGHGERKDPDRPLIARELLTDLRVWGKREPYERLVVDTVKDYRVVMDWVEQQPQFDAAQIRAVGYSMGAQMALLLAGIDSRVGSVAAMVPPHLDNKVAAVSPYTVASRLASVEVWLLTAGDDEYAAQSDNAALFASLPGANHQHLIFPGGHVLPAAYVDRLRPWLTSAANTGMASSPQPIPAAPEGGVARNP